LDGSLYGDKKEKIDTVDLQQSVNLFDNNKLVIGASWSDIKVDNLNHYNENLDTIAFFLNDTWEFAPTWTLNAGVRYDDHSEVGDETTFSAALNKKFDENNHMYINWGQVFNAPSTGDLFEYSDYGSFKSIGNRNLKAETGDTWTIGYNGILSDRTDFGVNYFESELDDAINWIDYVDDNGVWVSTVDNVDKQKKRGLEFNVNHKVNSSLKLTASYTYINVKNNENNSGFIKDWNYVPNTYRFGINYNEGKWDTNLYLRAGTGCATHTYLDKYYTPKISYVDNNFITVDFAVTYKATKDLSFFAKGYNLFNEAYAEQAGVSYGSYKFPAQSRRFIVGAEYKF